MSDLFQRDVHFVLGLPFDAVDMPRAVRVVNDAVADHKRVFLSTPNLNFLVNCLTDSEFRNSVIDSDLSVADGMPVVWAARLLRIPVRSRVTGSGIFEHLRTRSGNPIKVYFFGGAQGAAKAACKALNEVASGMACAGYMYPGFGSVEKMSNEETISRINACEPDFIVVSLGARKGQAWIVQNRTRLSAPVISHLGAVVNFVAGTVRRAPAWMQRTGLEWLWRIKEEPALWRRYAFDGLAFGRLILLRVLPHIALTFWLRLTTLKEPTSGSVRIQNADDATSIYLTGEIAANSTDSLRYGFEQAAASQRNIRIHMADVTRVDSAFLGSLALLHGHQRRTGRSLEVVGAPRIIRKLFHFACAEYLLDNPIVNPNALSESPVHHGS